MHSPNFKTGDLVYIRKELKAVSIIGWFVEEKDSINHFLMESFDSEEIVGVFIGFSMVNDSGKASWYNVLVGDKIYIFISSVLFGESMFND